MISSMTAFTRHSIQKDWGSATWELRTVNHRYFDLDIRLPDALRELEMSLREKAASQLRRGKIECSLRYKPAEDSKSITVNKEFVLQLAEASHEVREIWGLDVNSSLTDILSWPGVLRTVEIDKKNVNADILNLFDESLKDIIEMRRREGLATSRRIEERLHEILQAIAHVRERLPLVLTHQRTKILKRIDEFKLTIDPSRLEEEILLLMQKMDISEEIERLEIHVEEVRQALASETAVGRRLDFLMQELHREANTLGSKSADAEIAHAAIHLKVLIEQMREQVQNIE